ncbi:Salt stress-induced protein [Ananas comosus]|uniref:Salt stress-induced protein n=1 Tax=Ananas comosus TaxID=4615 RepID=A0A199VFW0_ANACO|nr:Salt stress-induced protein [Ananas comosus]
MSGLVKLGLWGGNEGTLHDIDGHPTRLTKIVIRSAHAIDALQFDYVEDGKTFAAGQWGGNGGNSDTIEFQPGEYLIAIKGTTGPLAGVANLVRSLTFISNMRTYGPFGLEHGTPFSVPVASGRIVAFYGRFGSLVDAFGIYLMPY